MNQYVLTFGVEGSSALKELEVQAFTLLEAEDKVQAMLSAIHGEDGYHLDHVTKVY